MFVRQVFFLPVTKEFVEQVIIREQPDSIVVSMGGQTALNVGVELFKEGILDKHNVQVLGTPIQVVMDTEDRQAFDDKMKEINKPTAKSFTADNLEEALEASEKIGFPLMIRSAYALGGQYFQHSSINPIIIISFIFFITVEDGSRRFQSKERKT